MGGDMEKWKNHWKNVYFFQWFFHQNAHLSKWAVNLQKRNFSLWWPFAFLQWSQTSFYKYQVLIITHTKKQSSLRLAKTCSDESRPSLRLSPKLFFHWMWGSDAWVYEFTFILFGQLDPSLKWLACMRQVRCQCGFFSSLCFRFKYSQRCGSF